MTAATPYYFVYCTWYVEDELRKYLPTATFVTKARAVNAKIAFVTAGDRRDRGWCHFDNGQEAFGHDVQGLVYEVPEGEGWIDYDDCEICSFTVHGEDGKAYDCWTYRQTNPGIAMLPPNYYFDHIPAGLKAWNFPQEYIDRVMGYAAAALPCPRADRPRPAGLPGQSADSR